MQSTARPLYLGRWCSCFKVGSFSLQNSVSALIKLGDNALPCKEEFESFNEMENLRLYRIFILESLPSAIKISNEKSGT